jgi:hypothetical protein
MYISNYYFPKAVRETAVSTIEIATRLWAGRPRNRVLDSRP